MAKKTAPNPDQVVEDFNNLSLEDKVDTFKAIQDILEMGKREAQRQLNLLQSIDNEKK